MKSTNVPSNLREKQEVNNPSAYLGIIGPNEKGNMKMPPEMSSTGISEKAIKIAVTKGEVLEIPVGNCKVNGNNTMELENGTIKEMKNPNAYKNMVNDRKARKEMEDKARQKDAKAQVGMEIG